MKDMLFDVSEKIVIITGGLGQIGAEFVKEFHKRGARVAVFSRSAGKAKAEKVLGTEIAGSPSVGLYRSGCICFAAYWRRSIYRPVMRSCILNSLGSYN